MDKFSENSATHPSRQVVSGHNKTEFSSFVKSKVGYFDKETQKNAFEPTSTLIMD